MFEYFISHKNYSQKYLTTGATAPPFGEIDMNTYSLDNPDFIYATDEEFKGYCDLNLTKDQWRMAQIVARRIPYHEFLHALDDAKKRYKNVTPQSVLSDLYDDLASSQHFYHPSFDHEDY